jgi:hypothetical protein
LTTFASFKRDGSPMVYFRLFGRDYELSMSRFSVLMGFSKSCKIDPQAFRNLDYRSFSFEISGLPSGARCSEIHNPTLRFLHRWLSFSLFPLDDTRKVTRADFRCLFAMVHKIKYTPVLDIVEYFKAAPKREHEVQCTSMVTRIAHNLGCLEGATLIYLNGQAPTVGVDSFIRAHLMTRGGDGNLYMKYPKSSVEVALPAAHLALYSVESLTLQLEDRQPPRHSVSGGPHTRSRVRREEEARQRGPAPLNPQHPPWDTEYGGGSGYHGGGSFYKAHGYSDYGAGPSHSARYPPGYEPLERDILFLYDQTARANEGIERIEHRLDEQSQVQTDIRSSLDTQNEALRGLFDHLGFDPDA